MLHIYHISEDTGEWSSFENMVIAESEEEAKSLLLEEYPSAKIASCEDWGEVTKGYKGSISNTGD
jgi:hypothetical protein